MACPSVRLLSSVSMTRRLVFGLVGSLPEYFAFFGLLAVLMCVGLAHSLSPPSFWPSAAAAAAAAAVANVALHVPTCPFFHAPARRYLYAVTGVVWFAGLMEADRFTTLINSLGAMFQACLCACLGCIFVLFFVLSLFPGGGSCCRPHRLTW